MTTQPTDQSEQPTRTLAQAFEDIDAEQAPLLVEPTAEDRLSQLQAAYTDAKAQADAAAKHLKTITDGIKAELFERVPEGTERIELRGNAGPTLRLTRVQSMRFDSVAFKKADPHTYVQYAKPSVSWTLKVGGDQ